MKKVVFLIISLLLAYSVSAKQYEVKVDAFPDGSTYDGGTGFAIALPFAGYNDIGSGVENFTYWQKFAVPAIASGHVLISATIDVNIANQYAGPSYPAGVYLNRVDDANWQPSTITSAWPVSATYTATNRDTSGPAYGLVTTDITNWFEDVNLYADKVLSIRYNALDAGGVRGCYFFKPSLTLVFEESPRKTVWSRGHDIMLKSGLQIQAQMFPASSDGIINMTNWQASNFTTANLQWGCDPNAMGAAPGIPWGRWAGSGSVTTAEEPYYENMVSFQYGDEQWLDQDGVIPSLKSVFDSWHRYYPEIMAFSNQGTGLGLVASDEAMRLYMQEAKPDLLIQDNYPFTSGWAYMTDFYYHLARYRQFGLEGFDPNYPASTDNKQPIPYGMYLQTYEMGGHTLSESEIRINQFSCWAFGCTFVSAFTYDSPADTGEFQWEALFSDIVGDTTPNTQFYQVAETNRQSRLLGGALVRLLSTGTYMIPNQHSLPSNMQAWAPSSYITGITTTNLGTLNGGNAGDVLIGYFKPLDEMFDGPTYSNQEYFMVVNGLCGPTASANDASQRISLVFNFGTSGITSLQKINRTTGSVDTVALTSLGGGNYKLDLVLKGGEGDLFKFNTGSPFITGPAYCGDPALEQNPADLSGSNGFCDCHVDLYDYAVLANEWQQSNDGLKVYTLNPIVSGSVIENQTGLSSTYTLIGYWGGPYYKSWQKFDVPVFTGEEIISTTFNTPQALGQTAGLPAGVVLYRADDDSWTSSTIAFSSPRIASTEKVHVSIFESLPAASAPRSTDITDYLMATGEGQGQLLTIAMENWYNGARGVAYTAPTLTITTKPLLSSRITLDADISGPADIYDGKVDFYDLEYFASEWLNCNDPQDLNCNIQP